MTFRVFLLFFSAPGLVSQEPLSKCRRPYRAVAATENGISILNGVLKSKKWVKETFAGEIKSSEPILTSHKFHSLFLKLMSWKTLHSLSNCHIRIIPQTSSIKQKKTLILISRPTTSTQRADLFTGSVT